METSIPPTKANDPAITAPYSAILECLQARSTLIFRGEGGRSTFETGGGVGNLYLMCSRPPQKCEGVAGFHVMAIEWEEKVPEIVEGGGLYPRPKLN